MSTTDPHSLTGAYAAHALSAEEKEAFEDHLADCPSCTQEVAEFAATLARLGAAEAVPVPAELKTRVLAALPGVRQEAPLVPAAAATGRKAGRFGRSGPRLALAACLAVALGASAVAVQQHRDAGRAHARALVLEQQQAAVAALLTAPDARTARAAASTGGGSATVVWSASRGRAGFLAVGLPAPGAGRTYQLWFDDAGTMRPAGLLPTGNGTLLLSGELTGISGLGVTLEPAGGSARPSGAPVLLLPFD